ncbi:gallinacin-10-like [Varanus komodoensis]|uniref:gallinacin-10-like n=1 Tax=Varanus komodoensis TaxID=61221 RepID=UPI001CF7B8B2|nr:gallinacin-10-like [Varanus komodoensis]
MRFLYFFVAVVVLLFQICPGYGLVPAGLSDTIKCRTTPRSFCKAVVCPPTFEPTGTCFGGSMHCCSK